MRIQLVVLLLAAVFAGCSRDDQPATGMAQSDPAAVGAEVSGKPLEEALPHGIELGLPYHLIRDWTEESEPGKFERRVRLEYLGLDRQQAIDAASASLTAAGYRAGKPTQRDDGRIRITFTHGQHPSIRLVEREGGELEHPSANGVIYLRIPAEAPIGTE